MNTWDVMVMWAWACAWASYRRNTISSRADHTKYNEWKTYSSRSRAREGAEQHSSGGNEEMKIHFGVHFDLGTKLWQTTFLLPVESRTARCVMQTPVRLNIKFVSSFVAVNVMMSCPVYLAWSCRVLGPVSSGLTLLQPWLASSSNSQFTKLDLGTRRWFLRQSQVKVGFSIINSPKY